MSSTDTCLYAVPYCKIRLAQRCINSIAPKTYNSLPTTCEETVLGQNINYYKIYIKSGLKYTEIHIYFFSSQHSFVLAYISLVRHNKFYNYMPNIVPHNQLVLTPK